jgi:hypothetical protein
MDRDSFKEKSLGGEEHREPLPASDAVLNHYNVLKKP